MVFFEILAKFFEKYRYFVYNRGIAEVILQNLAMDSASGYFYLFEKAEAETAAWQEGTAISINRKNMGEKQAIKPKNLK